MITIKQISITDLSTDAIVNAANEHLQAGGGVCGAIFSAAGYDKLQAACDKIKHCDTGSAVITSGFDLKAKYIIHAIGPIWRGGQNGEPQALYNAYKRSLELAAENECRSIGFPLISAGIFGYPLKDAWKQAVQACLDFEKSSAYSLEIVFAVLDRRIIDTGLEILNELEHASRLSFDRLLISGRQVNAVFFHLPEEPYGFLSNWYMSSFDLDGVHYSSMEQYIMHQKCILFGDQSTAKKVLLTDDPSEQQKLGKLCSGYINGVWAGARQAIAMRGLLAKFSQNADLKEQLLNTSEAYLVECAHSDKIWACGIRLTESERFDATKWTGQNILGFALMAVREIIKKNREVNNIRSIDKFRGCLIGGAAGDALGYAVEFMHENQIISKYGNDGITEYELKNGVAEISDDTQMTLFTANGLLFGTTRGMTRGIMGDYESYIQIMYQNWYKTQTETYPIQEEYLCSWLMNIPSLFSRRAPGNTCLSAIKHGADGSTARPINDSKGCGGVMRVAPIGLYFADKHQPFEMSDKLGAEAAALTHGHDLGYIPAAALAHIIRTLLEESISLKDAVKESIDAMRKLFPAAKHIDEFTSIMEKAIMLSETASDDMTAIHQLGEGWVAEETLAIAVYSALKYERDFDKAIRTAVNHNGDSDSTGAVCGNILGTYLGYDAIPKKYKEHLELHDIIIEIADDLYNDCQISEFDPNHDEVWESKYIYATYNK